jgi:hypothetical protein
MQRSPTRARPWRRVMFVAVDVSSRNTSFSMSSVDRFGIQSRRARCTSSRSCSLACGVFFKAQAPFVQLMPQRWNLDGNSMLPGQPLAHPGQRQIRLVRDPPAKRRLQGREDRHPMSAYLKTRPPAFRMKLLADLMHPAAAHLVPLGYVRRAFTPLQCVEHPIPQVLGISAQMCPSYGQRHHSAKTSSLKSKTLLRNMSSSRCAGPHTISGT